MRPWATSSPQQVSNFFAELTTPYLNQFFAVLWRPSKLSRLVAVKRKNKYDDKLPEKAVASAVGLVWRNVAGTM